MTATAALPTHHSNTTATAGAARRGSFHRAAATVRAPHEAIPRADVAMIPQTLLGGDESILFAIKPSLWFVFFDSAVWLVGCLVAILCGSWIARVTPSMTEPQVMSAVLTVAGIRVGIALLRWVSRFYVLTNRRMMRIRGVFKADVFECPLVNIRNTVVTHGFPEALANLGTLHFIISESGEFRAAWRNLPHPHDVHAEVRKAIRRAIDCQPHL
ncbi:MAG: PH domain-containing protein [Phycisphaerales bacterium]|nr:PH domain-containing protein [Phycisphaerales bacterium]